MNDSQVGVDAGGPVVDTLSVLFTDLVASTEMRGRLGDEAAEVVRRLHDQLIVEVAEHGATEEARFVLERLEPWAEWWAAWAGLATLGPVPLAIARLRALLGDTDGSEDAFAESIARCRANDSRYFLAESLLYLGVARAERGESAERVTPPLREAFQLAQEGGYGTILRRGETALTNTF